MKAHGGAGARKVGMALETFQVPLAVDLFAVGIGSLQGAMFAAGFKRIDLLGVSLIGISVGFGGSMLRDLLLNVPLAALSSNWYLVAAVGCALLGMLLQRVLTRVDPLITFFDALSIGIYGALGTTKALSLGLPAVPALFVGTLAAVGGGMLRDLLLNIPVAMMHVGSLYAVAALIGNASVLLSLALGANALTAGIICVALTTLIRLLAVRFGWSLPEQRTLSRNLLRRQRQVEETIEALRTGAITVEMLTFNPDGTATLKEDGGDDDESDDESRARRR